MSRDRPQSRGPEHGVEPSHLERARRLLRKAADERPAVEGELARAGVRDPAAALDKLAALPVPAEEPERRVEVLGAALQCADPDAALEWTLDFARAYPGEWCRPRPELRGDSLRALIRTVAFCRFAAERIGRDPSLLEVFGWGPPRFARDRLLRDAFRAFEGADDRDEGRVALARWQACGQLAIAKFDLSEEVPLRDLFSFTSMLADATLGAALAAAKAELAQDAHLPPEGSAFFVLALGKLGGAELNFSSDVDLMFIWSAETEAGECQVYYDRLGRAVIRFLGQRDVVGPLYRVDLRLRPEGSSGPLTRSLESCLRYYRKLGRPWERQMLLKARVTAGDAALGERFLEAIRPFLIGASLDAPSIEQLKELRKRTERRVAGATRTDRLEIKNGPGGIRDIETVVQFHQLLHAGHEQDVLHGNTLQALQRLQRVRALSAHEHEALLAAYSFLRRVENRLQMVFDLPARHLPTEEKSLSRLARSLGFESSPAGIARFLAQVERARRDARRVYTSRITERFEPTSPPEQEVRHAVLRAGAEEPGPHAELAALGFREPDAAYQALQSLAEPGSRFLPRRSETRAMLADMTPSLLERLARAPDPDLALHHLGRVASRFHGRHAFLQTLIDQPAFLDLLVDIGSYSPFLTDVLVRDPDALDSFVDNLLVESSGARQRRRRLDLDSLRQARQPLLFLHEYRSLELLRIGLRDVQNKASLIETQFALARLAVHVLLRLLEWCLSEEHRSSEGFAVLAVGKLGGLEISYGSDVDVIFVVDEREWSPDRAAAVAQRFLARAGEHTQLGRLYRVDTRLRPEGESGELVSTLNGFEQYYRSDRAALFEYQALLKASPLAGDRQLARRALQLVRSEALRRGRSPGVVEELLAMRRRIQDSASPVDLKRGPGGMLDAEFLVQGLQLRHGGEHPEILQPNLLRSLRNLERAGLIETRAHEELREHYLFLRLVESRLQLLFGTESHCLPEDREKVEQLARRCGFEGEGCRGAFESRLEEARTVLAERRERSLGPLP